MNEDVAIAEFLMLHHKKDSKKLRIKRNNVILKMRSQGMTYQQIGKRIDLSREGVRQVVLLAKLD